MVQSELIDRVVDIHIKTQNLQASINQLHRDLVAAGLIRAIEETPEHLGPPEDPELGDNH